MKQILTYISPDKKFNDEHQMAVKIQIDNSIELGWRREDILIVTNFEFEYNGVKSVVIEDDNYCDIHWPATKIWVIVRAFEMVLIEENEMYWYHDFDCFQLSAFKEGEPNLGECCMGLTNYGRMPRLCSASIFFKRSAIDIFRGLKREVEVSRKDEEMGIARMIGRDENLRERVKLLNITYAFHKFNLISCWQIATLPVRAVHFHLTSDKYDFYVRGNNKLGVPLIPKTLIDLFHKHGFTG